jgi:hypothetical protein
MQRGIKSRSMLVCAIVATMLGPIAPGATAGPAATEEYVLELPGVDSTQIGPPEPIVDRARRAGPIGVVGEQEPAGSRLAALGSIATTAGGLTLLLVLAGGAALVTSRGRSGR